jgi:sugar phosphate isomerase/epimerase
MSDTPLPIGCTSLFFSEMGIFEIAERLLEHGLGLEVHLNDFDPILANPKPLRAGGVWPRTFGAEDRRRLRDLTGPMPVVTVHGTPYDLNICANNPAIREESIRQYEEAMDLGRDLGAAAVTFPAGRASDVLQPPSVCLERIVAFAKRMVPRAEQYGISTGLENEGGLGFYLDVIAAVDSPRWGHLLDLGNAVAGAMGGTDTVLAWIDRLGVQRLTEVHVHNVLAWSVGPGGIYDHQAFQDGTCLDMPTIFAKLKNIGYAGPIIFEILQNTADKVIDACLRARDVVAKAYGL